MISAGGGTVVEAYDAEDGADLAITPAGAASAQLQRLLEAKVCCLPAALFMLTKQPFMLMLMQVPCASPCFLVQWLSQPFEDLSQHLLHGSKLSGRLARAAAARQHTR